MKLTEQEKQEVRIQKIIAKMINFLMTKYNMERHYVMLMFSPEEDNKKLVKVQTLSNMDFKDAFPLLKDIVEKYESCEEQEIDMPGENLTELTPAHLMSGSKTIQ